MFYAVKLVGFPITAVPIKCLVVLIQITTLHLTPLPPKKKTSTHADTNEPMCINDILTLLNLDIRWSFWYKTDHDRFNARTSGSIMFEEKREAIAMQCCSFGSAIFVCFFEWRANHTAKRWRIFLAFGNNISSKTSTIVVRFGGIWADFSDFIWNRHAMYFPFEVISFSEDQ